MVTKRTLQDSKTASQTLVGLICLTVFIFFALSPKSGLGAVSAILEREQIDIYDTVRLIIKSDNSQSGVKPDFSILEQNFNILGTSSTQNVSIINGSQKFEKSWISEIEPKSVGSYTIPPIRVGNEATRPLRLTVLPGEAQNNSEDVFLEFEIDQDRPYVQQQIIATVKLHLAVNLIDGSLSDPASENLNVIRMGKDIQYQKRIGDKPYRVIERKYAIFANASGQITLSPLRFQGVIEDRSSTNQTFNNMFNQSSRISARSKPLTIHVQPPAPEFIGRTWLPATQIEFRDLSTKTENIEPGQPVTIRYQLIAKGLTAEQLPETGFKESPLFKQYPDKVSGETTHQEGEIVSTLNQSIALIANQAGTLEIPEISVNWWNVQTNKMETAILPSRNIQVSEPDTNTISSQPIASTDTATNDALNKGKTPEETPLNWSSLLKIPEFIWLPLVLLIGWVVTGALLFREIGKNREVNNDSAPNPDRQQTIKTVQKNIKTACQKNDPTTCRKLLLQWAMLEWPDKPINGLTDVVQQCSSVAMKDQIKHLDSVLYSNSNDHHTHWSGAMLEQAFFNNTDRNQRSHTNNQSRLPPLHPMSE